MILLRFTLHPPLPLRPPRTFISPQVPGPSTRSADFFCSAEFTVTSRNVDGRVSVNIRHPYFWVSGLPRMKPGGRRFGETEANHRFSKAVSLVRVRGSMCAAGGRGRKHSQHGSGRAGAPLPQPTKIRHQLQLIFLSLRSSQLSSIYHSLRPPAPALNYPASRYNILLSPHFRATNRVPLPW